MQQPTIESLFRKDDFSHADLAIVFGANEPELDHRITTGAELITSGRVQKLLLTGDGRRRHSATRTEAARMRDIAVSLGVRPSNIIIEDKSQDTIANAQKCRALIEANSELRGIQSVALVSSAWHMLRVFMLMRRCLRDVITLFCHPTPDGHTADNWETSAAGQHVVANEIRLIGKLLRKGYRLP